MIWSDAFPPARNDRKHHVATVATFIGLFALLVTVLWLTSCTGVSSGPQNSASNISVNLTPGSASVSSGGTQQFTATVQNTTNTAVTWSASSGTVTSNGLYTAPTVTTTTSATVTATSVADSSVSASVSVTIKPASSVSVSVTPASASLPSAGSQQFTATVQNTTNAAVTWSASSGSITSSGLYTAPTVTTATSATVTATSVADSTASASAAVTISPAQSQSLVVTTTYLSQAIAGTAYSNALAASGGTTPYNWTLASGTLPTGIAVQSTGSLSGTTTQTGSFTFSVHVADSSSPQQTATQSFILTVNSSTSGNTIALSFFGADFNNGGIWPPTDGLNNTASLGGLRLWDDGVKWSDITTASGVYDWTTLDNWLGKAESSNMDVLYTFGATPEFAATTPPPSGCLSPGIYSCAAPVDLNADGTGTDAYFSAFVTALVTHAAGRISYYELWNEADSPGFWGGTTAQMVRMGQDAAAIIRSLDPNAKILSPSAHGDTMSTWFDGYIVAGGAANFDIVNVHMRPGPDLNAIPEQFLTVYGQVETELQAQNLTSLPLWDDEHGIEIGELTDPDMLAGYVARSAILRAGVSLQRQYVYSWDSVAPYGLQGNASGTAWDQVASWLVGHSISPCVASGTVYTCQLDNGQIVWDTAQSCSNGVCTTSSYTYPQYLYSHDIAGTRTTLSGTTVQIGYKPILLANQ